MTEYSFEKGLEYHVLPENSVHKREMDVLIGKKFNSLSDVLGIVKKLSEPLHIRKEDMINIEFLNKFSIYYRYSPDYEVATVNVS